jgi:hypothetical protein
MICMHVKNLLKKLQYNLTLGECTCNFILFFASKCDNSKKKKKNVP